MNEADFDFIKNFFFNYQKCTKWQRNFFTFLVKLMPFVNNKFFFNNLSFMDKPDPPEN